MPRPHTIRPIRYLARLGIVATLVALIGVATAGCGQRGPLYLPDKDNPEKRR